MEQTHYTPQVLANSSNDPLAAMEMGWWFSVFIHLNCKTGICADIPQKISNSNTVYFQECKSYITGKANYILIIIECLYFTQEN